MSSYINLTDLQFHMFPITKVDKDTLTFMRNTEVSVLTGLWLREPWFGSPCRQALVPPLQTSVFTDRAGPGLAQDLRRDAYHSLLLWATLFDEEC